MISRDSAPLSFASEYVPGHLGTKHERLNVGVVETIDQVVAS